MAESTKSHPFVTYLEGLAGDRAALAALRRGLGQPPGTVADMYPYVVPRLPAGLSRAEEDAFYIIAAAFAYHPLSATEGNFGDHMAASVRSSENQPAVERRFVSLLNAHPDDLADQLRQAISFLRSKEIPVNWHQLLRDVCAWGHPDRYVQRRWANAFWSAPESIAKSDVENE